jgi:hypothetical protein
VKRGNIDTNLVNISFSYEQNVVEVIMDKNGLMRGAGISQSL